MKITKGLISFLIVGIMLMTFSSCNGYGEIISGSDADVKLHDSISSIENVGHGNFEGLKEAVEEVKSIDTILDSKINPVYYAMSNASDEFVDYLLSKGANPNYIVKDAPLICHAAGYMPKGVTVGKIDTLEHCKLLIKYGCNINSTSKEGYNALDCALMSDNYDIVDYLIENGVTISEETPQILIKLLKEQICYYPAIITLFKKAELPNSISDCVAMSIKENTIRNYNVFDKASEIDIKNSMFFSAAKDDLETVKYLIDRYNMNVDCTDENNLTLLSVAVMNRSENVINYLLSNSKLNNIIKTSKEKPLLFAIKNNDIDLCKKLIKCGVPLTSYDGQFGKYDDIASVPDGVDYDYEDLIEKAIYSGSKNILELIIDSYNLTDSQRYEMLVLCTQKGELENLKYLLSLDAFVRVTKENKNILDDVFVIYQKNNVDCVQLLIDNGVNIDGDIEGSTPLITACINNDLDIIKCLISNGADINVYIDDTSPITEAIAYGNFDSVKYLIEQGCNIDDEVLNAAKNNLSKNIYNYINDYIKTST